MTDSRPDWYTARYCEENAWHLCQHARTVAAGPRHVVFLSSPADVFAMWSQRAAPSPRSPIVWDYHVVVVTRGPPAQVWDLDTRRGWPVDATQWTEASFPYDDRLDASLRPRFRVVDSETFVRTFASDRSHMRTPDGSWESPPPTTPCIRTPDSTMNLMRFVDTGRPFVGTLLPDLAAFRTWLGGG